MNTTRSLPLLSQVRIASPCSMRWEEMEGNDRTRFCRSCSLHVHNLSAMTSAEAEALLSRGADDGERLCGMFYKRADGTVLTQDCPVGLAGVKARVRRRLARIAAAIGLMATGGALATGSGAEHGTPRLRALRPFSILSEWLAPAPPPPPPLRPVPGLMVMGKMACPPGLPPPPPVAPSPAPGSTP